MTIQDERYVTWRSDWLQRCLFREVQPSNTSLQRTASSVVSSIVRDCFVARSVVTIGVEAAAELDR